MDLAAESLRDERELAVLVMSRMLQLLEEQGKEKLRAGSLVVHLDNRSGMMVNAFSCRQKGWEGLRYGWSKAKLGVDSFAMETSRKALKDQ